MQLLYSLISGKDRSQQLHWTDSALTAISATKDALVNASLLTYPASDTPTCLMTDTSDTAVGAVLQQNIDGTWLPKMTPAETRYTTFNWELLAVYLAIRHFRHFPKGRTFHVLRPQATYLCLTLIL